jgi:N-glycosylase/DNA lyase
MLPPMDLDLTLGCGQVFRWFKTGDRWSGVIDGKELILRQVDGEVEVIGDVPEERLLEYFRSDDDVESIYREVSVDDLMGFLIKSFGGMRLIRQDPWECCLSYILASNANITRIQGMVESVCEAFGDPLPGGRHAFPCPSDILDHEELALDCGLGYRCGWMVQLAREVDEGNLDLESLRREDYASCIEHLKGFMGIGDKVTDCIALFCLDHLEAFPVDVRIRRVMEEVYGASGSYRRIREFGQQHFGRYAGYAQELLYHWDGIR